MYPQTSFYFLIYLLVYVYVCMCVYACVYEYHMHADTHRGQNMLKSVEQELQTIVRHCISAENQIQAGPL